MSDIGIEVDVRRAAEELHDAGDDLDSAGRRIVSQLVTLAEASMKEEAPRGAGIPDNPLRSTIRSSPSRPAKKKTVMPHKRTSEGWLLVRAIVGNPRIPRYRDDPPPVWTDSSGTTQGPIAEWTQRKLGDRDAAWPVAMSILDRGEHESFPNRFVSRSVQSWRSRVEDIAGDVLDDSVEGIV